MGRGAECTAGPQRTPPPTPQGPRRTLRVTCQGHGAWWPRTWLFSSAPLSKAEQEPIQEKGVVPALTAPCHGTKSLGRAGGAHVCSGISLSEAGALSGHPPLFFVWGLPRRGHTKEDSQFLRVKRVDDQGEGCRDSASTCLQGCHALSTEPSNPGQWGEQEVSAWGSQSSSGRHPLE